MLLTIHNSISNKAAQAIDAQLRTMSGAMNMFDGRMKINGYVRVKV